jgi:hypothetical protein
MDPTQARRMAKAAEEDGDQATADYYREWADELEAEEAAGEGDAENPYPPGTQAHGAWLARHRRRPAGGHAR